MNTHDLSVILSVILSVSYQSLILIQKETVRA